jgi:2-hydroxycyclohexanecarboxyl-CoA dehydrogenase
MSLHGKMAVVSGGASGIGRSICLRLARDGADVAVLDLDLAGAEKVVEEITGLKRRAVALQIDVIDRDQVKSAVGRVHGQLGAVHILVNSAGIGDFVPFARISEDQWDRMIAVHLKGLFNCAQAVLPDMIDGKWGRIVTISSVAGLAGAPGLVHYSAAKAGVIGFSKALAREVGRKGVTVNTIAPGIIDTPLLQGTVSKDDHIRDIFTHTVRAAPINRVGTPDDVATACAYVVSEEAGFFTGQVLSPNGGIYT